MEKGASASCVPVIGVVVEASAPAGAEAVRRSEWLALPLEVRARRAAGLGESDI